MGPLNIGVVGCGDAAQHVYLPEFHRMKEKALLVAVCDRVEERAVAVRTRFGAKASYTDLHRFLRESDAHIVLNLTPHREHAAVSLAAPRQGNCVHREADGQPRMSQHLIEAASVRASNSRVPPHVCGRLRGGSTPTRGGVGRPTFARAQALAASLGCFRRIPVTCGGERPLWTGCLRHPALESLWSRLAGRAAGDGPERAPCGDGPFAGTVSGPTLTIRPHVHLDWGSCSPAGHLCASGQRNRIRKCTVTPGRCRVTR